MVDFIMDDTYENEMIDSTGDVAITSSMGSKTGVGELAVDMEHGHHTIRRAVTPIHRVIMYLNRLGLLNKDQLKILLETYGCIVSITGAYLLYWSVRDFINVIKAYQAARAAGETAQHAFVQDWGSIAIAAIAAGVVAASFATGVYIAQYQSSHQVDYTTSAGQRQIIRDVHSDRGSMG